MFSLHSLHNLLYLYFLTVRPFFNTQCYSTLHKNRSCYIIATLNENYSSSFGTTLINSLLNSFSINCQAITNRTIISYIIDFPKDNVETVTNKSNKTKFFIFLFYSLYSFFHTFIHLATHSSFFSRVTKGCSFATNTLPSEVKSTRTKPTFSLKCD